MCRKNISKIFKYLFMYVLFFNTLFFGINEAMASSFRESTAGAKDRVRSFRKGEIMFRFNKDTGFSCDVGGLKIYPNIDDYENKIDFSDSVGEILKDMSANFGKNLLAILGDMVLEVFLHPLFCVSLLRGMSNTGSGSSLSKKLGNGTATSDSNLAAGMSGVLGILFALVGSTVVTQVLDLVLGEDDYNLDPTNKYCAGYVVADMITCFISLIIWKLNIKLGTKIAIILCMNAVYYTAKLIAFSVFFVKAQEAFDQLSLCGDDWNVYGNEELYEKYKDKDPSNNPFQISDIWDYYPAKGAYFGSYQYLLNECFQNKDETSCKKLFSNVLKKDAALTETTFKNLSNILQKPYREYKYGGVEYSYSGCKDPRPERVGYLNTSDRESQLYYFRGNEAANFACDRFLVKDTPEYNEAYRCCLNASQKFVCVVNKDENCENGSCSTTKNHVLCEKGKTCKIATKIDFGDEDENYKSLSCEDIKQSLESASDGLDEDGRNTIYGQFCDENGILNEDFVVEEQKPIEKEKGKIVLKIKESIYEEDKYCVETYSLCPYNFKIKGGTEIFGDEFSATREQNIKVKAVNESVPEEKRVYKQKTYFKKITEDNDFRNCTFTKDGEKSCTGACAANLTENEVEYFSCYGRASNFCQLDRHCVKIPKLFEIEKPDTNPYVDEACINLVGSSHNFDNYSSVVKRTNASFFLSAPLVECLTETTKNILLNTAGHTKCLDTTESPINGKCVTGGAKYEKGETLNEEKYPAAIFKLRKYFFNIMKAMLALAVVLYGYSSLIARKGFSSVEDVLKFLLTLTFVTYFSVSTNWIKPVFNAVYITYNSVSELALTLLTDEADYESPKYGGCYFLKSKYIDNNYDKYENRKYLAVFDTLDCKLSRYFGYYLNASVNPPIISLLIAGVCTFGVSIIMMIPLLLLFVGLLYFVVNTTLSFITASITIAILLLLSPIMIPLYLFERTREKFNKWIKVIIRNVFSPLFLIMGMFLFFIFFDKYFVGDAVFIGEDEPLRNVYCGTICKINENNFYYIAKNDTTQENNCKTTNRGKVINLSEKSLICVLQNATKKTKSTGVGIINFIIADFKGLPGLFMETNAFFTCFLDIVFLLILLFIFNKFIPFVDSLTETIFGLGFEGKSNVDSNIISMKKMMNSVAAVGGKLVKTTAKPGKMFTNRTINAWHNRDRGFKMEEPKPTPKNTPPASNDDESTAHIGSANIKV